jgi:multidrug efflux pump
VNAGMPLFIVVVLSLLMIQLRSFSRTVMVFLTAPLGLIVTLFLLVFRQPFGLSPICTMPCGHDHAQLGDPGGPGSCRRDGALAAIIEATVRRPPIVLTAGGGAGDDSVVAQCVLPMAAVAIMGGIDRPRR